MTFLLALIEKSSAAWKITTAKRFRGATKTVYSNAIIQLIHIRPDQIRLGIKRNVNQSYFLMLHLTNLGVYHPNDHQSP